MEKVLEINYSNCKNIILFNTQTKPQILAFFILDRSTALACASFD